MIAYGWFALDRSAQRVEQDQALSAVADPLAALCAQDASVRARVGAACDTAVQVVETKEAAAVAGTNGRDGLNGKDGRDGTNGKDGLTPACLSTPTQCVGAPGRDGVDGKDGRDGTNGKDGADGRDGKDGRDGQACVAPQVWAAVTYADGQTGSSCVDPPKQEEQAP